MSQELTIVEELASFLVHDCKCLVLWIAFAMPMVFNRVLDDNGAFKAALHAVAALVLDVVGFTTHGCCVLTACGFWRCVIAAGLSAVVGDDAFDCVFLMIRLASTPAPLEVLLWDAPSKLLCFCVG